jgi:hypothetical protein
MKIIEKLETTKAMTLKYYDLDAEQLDSSYEPGSWSIRYILHHIADAETVLYDRIKRVISEPKQVLRAFDQDAWAGALGYSSVPVELSKNIYAAVRDGIIYNARRFYESKGHLEFMHSETGIRTLKQEFDKVVIHNDGHLEQIRKALDAS